VARNGSWTEWYETKTKSNAASEVGQANCLACENKINLKVLNKFSIIWQHVGIGIRIGKGNFACRVVRNIKSYASPLFLLPLFTFLISEYDFSDFVAVLLAISQLHSFFYDYDDVFIIWSTHCYPCGNLIWSA